LPRVPSSIQIVIGEHDRSDEGNENREVRNVEAVFVHEEYGDLATYDSDIALLKVSDDLANTCM
jgi:hypothetical protein